MKINVNSNSAEVSTGTPARPSISPWLLAVLLGLATAALYWPSLHNGFVNYDDDDYVRANLEVQKGLTLENFQWAFCHIVVANWHPVTMLSHMVDCQLYGLNPWGHHLTSLLLHAANTSLLFLLLYRLTGLTWRSAVVAALFAAHPLHVESVVWVAERKDVLSTFFGFLTLLFYVRYAQAQAGGSPEPATGRPPGSFHRVRDYWLACLCFALGLMSKPMLVTWPFVLLLLDFWPLGRFPGGRVWPLVKEKIPFFILTVLASAVTVLAQKHGGAVQTLNSLGVELRFGNAVISYGRYLLKFFWPVDLAIYYPFPKVTLYGSLLLAVIVLTVISVLFWWQRRRRPFFLMGWLWFIGTLVPVIGLVQVGSQCMADRYTYVPSVGLFILVSWGACELCRRCHWQRVFLSVATFVTLILCCCATRHQIAYWHDSETLFRHALSVTEDNPIMENNLATVKYDQGRTNEAIGGFQQALRLDTNYAEPHLNLGNLLVARGQTNQGLAELQSAVAIKPRYLAARYCLGALLLQLGQIDPGVANFKVAILYHTNDPASSVQLANLLLSSQATNAAINQLQTDVRTMPANADLHYKLGNLLLSTGQTDDAIDHFQTAIRLKPDFFEAHNNLASLFLKKGLVDQAIAELHESIRLKPGFADAYFNLGTIFFKQGLNDEAAGEFQTVIRLSPDFAQAHYYLGVILTKKGRPDAAIAEFQAAIRLKPDYAFAHNKLGIALGTIGRLNEAVAEFQAAVRLKPDYAEANTNLAIALKMQAAASH